MKAYKLIVESAAYKDYLGFWEWEQEWQDLYSSKSVAIKFAQRFASKRHTVHCKVVELDITEKGCKNVKCVYNIYKERK